MRLFIALTLPDAVKDEVMRLIASCRAQRIKASYVTRDKLHITLAFLGDVDETQCLQILQEIVVPELSLTIDHIGHFRDTYYVGCKDHPELTAFTARLREQLQSVGFTNASSFIPHITFARHVKKEPVLEVRPMTADVEDVVLYDSVRTEGRYIYQVKYVCFKEKH